MMPRVVLPGLMVQLINLPRSVERRQRMEQRLAQLGLQHELFPAIDGKAEQNRLYATVDIPAFERHVGRSVLPGEVGCYHSHLAVWKRFLDADAQVLLVLEDDVVFHADFLAALRVALEGRAHWDFLKLNKIRANQPVCQGLLGAYKLNAYAGTATGFGAYLIQRDVAQRLLPTLLPIRAPIDRELDQIHRHDFRHFGLEPFPSHPQDEGLSTITGAGFSSVDRFPLSRRWTKYALQTVGTARRLWYLASRGRLWPRRLPLAMKELE